MTVRMLMQTEKISFKFFWDDVCNSAMYALIPWNLQVVLLAH